MNDINIIKKVCGFYVSTMHLITMLLPFIKNQTNNNVKIETFLEYNLNKNVSNVLNNLVINNKEKANILNINWNSSRIQRYSNIEKKLKNYNFNNNEVNIIISGSRKYIEECNKILERFINRNKNILNNKNTSIINCYEVNEFDDNIREILDNHDYIINTSGIHKIEDIFEDYKSKKAN